MHHNRGALQAGDSLEIIEHKRRRDSIGQIRNELVGSLARFDCLLAKCSDQIVVIQTQGVFADEREIVEIVARLVKYGRQIGIALNGEHVLRARQKRHGQRANARAYLEHVVLFTYLGKLANVRDNGIVHQKVLAERMFRGQTVARKHVARRSN